jgi:hypothetical protein
MLVFFGVWMGRDAGAELNPAEPVEPLTRAEPVIPDMGD